MLEIKVPYSQNEIVCGVILTYVNSLLPNASLRSEQLIESTEVYYGVDINKHWSIQLQFARNDLVNEALYEGETELILEENNSRHYLCLSKGSDRDKVVISSRLKRVETLRELSDQVNIALNVLFERFKAVHGLKVEPEQGDNENGESTFYG